MHGDVKKLSESLSHDSRIGGRFLHAGLGFGGGCLPKDIRAFMARAGELGVDQARDVPQGRRRDQPAAPRADGRARPGGAGQRQFRGARVGVLGAAFKPNSDDIRDSPALDVARRIHRQGASVVVYDPAAMDNARRAYPDLATPVPRSRRRRDADVVLHLTEWREFRDMTPDVLSDVVRHKRILDGRNALDPQRWRDAGWTYRAFGRP